ncbi:putative eka-like protein [Erysiphe necator]|uniref:Putative eka-like protein n=1 Tax=Uncinula necator TaxID=52586 RepID=A0A0B1PBB4_UNCNE|nr:putative eka-like protein [Erysiphe necator]
MCSPLEFSQQTKGVKINAISNMNLPKKPTVAATHRINATLKTANALPIVPKTTPMLWTTVVRNGQKKTRLNEPNNKKQLKSTDDMRLFVRLSNEHEWRKLSPAGIREVVFKKLSISPTSIGLIKPVRTGFALSPRNNEAREALLKLSLRLSSFEAKLEPATSWLPVIIPTVPRYIRTEKGQVEVTKELLSDEIERVTSMRPNSIKLYGHGHLEAPHRTWLALFTKAPRPGFRVFDEFGIMSLIKKQPLSDFCKRCNGYHSPKNCSRAPSCGNCGSTMHSEDLCMAPTKCKNCGGPHRSDSRKCLARPTRNGAPAKEQLKIIRQAGDREFQAVLRAKAAEERASVLEGNFDEEPSQPEVVDMENTQASSVEDTAGDAMRL